MSDTLQGNFYHSDGVYAYILKDDGKTISYVSVRGIPGCGFETDTKISFKNDITSFDIIQPDEGVKRKFISGVLQWKK